MEKNGAITGDTPAEILPRPQLNTGGCGKPACCRTTKVGSGGSADHASSRAADAVTQAVKRK